MPDSTPGGTPMARGMSEVAASSLEEEFASLEDADTEAEVEARLAGLRGG